MRRVGIARAHLEPPINRILARMQPGAPDECWVWPGADNGVGYGVVGAGGGQGSNVYVHRVMYEHLRGPIPAGLVLDHLCRQRKCCNPAHLEPVSHRVNLLRGVGPSARNASVTACPQGHAYDEANTYRYPDGSRRCKACAREAQRRRRAARKAAA